MDLGEQIDRINELRFASDQVGVHRLALQVWSAWQSGDVANPVGLGALCQVAFVNGVDTKVPADAPVDDPRREVAAHAQLWRARATAAATMNGELNTTAMLLVPLAMLTQAQGFANTALSILDEVRSLADVIEHRGAPELPGVNLNIVRRVAHEKRGWVLWRERRYAESLESYDEARPFTFEPSRDRLRVDAGRLLASLGIGRIDVREGARQFRELEVQGRAGQWIDVAERLARNVELLEGGEVDVQQLIPMEIE